MNGNLSNVDESVLISEYRVKTINFDNAIRHKVNERLRLLVGELAVTNIGQVDSFQALFDEGIREVEGKLANVKESQNSDGFVSAAPKIQERLIHG